jgi:hypothetical protein
VVIRLWLVRGIISGGVETVSHVEVGPMVRVQEHRSRQDAGSLPHLQMLYALGGVEVLVVVWVTRRGGVRLEVVAPLDRAK